MQALPPKFLQPIVRTGKNTVIQGKPTVLPVKVEQVNTYTPPPGSFPSEGFGGYTGSEAFTGGYTGSVDYTGGDYTTGADFGGAEQYSAGQY